MRSRYLDPKGWSAGLVHSLSPLAVEQWWAHGYKELFCTFSSWFLLSTVPLKGNKQHLGREWKEVNILWGSKWITKMSLSHSRQSQKGAHKHTHSHGQTNNNTHSLRYTVVILCLYSHNNNLVPAGRPPLSYQCPSSHQSSKHSVS